MKALIEITKESGEVIFTKEFEKEEWAHDHFEEMIEIRHPKTYLNYSMNLSEYYGGGCIGTVRVVAIGNERYTRREMYRNA